MIRVAAKAVIVRDRKLLVIACRAPDGSEFFQLPGGGQEKFETLAEALRRECREEIGTDVEVAELLFVRDYIARNHEFAAENPDGHNVELMFVCRVPDDYEPRTGATPDPWQQRVTWLALDELAAAPLYPAVLRSLIASGRAGATYLGDVN